MNCCDDYGQCQQGKNCPVRQACELPEEDRSVMQSVKEVLKGLVMAVALVIMCLGVAMVLIPPL